MKVKLSTLSITQDRGAVMLGAPAPSIAGAGDPRRGRGDRFLVALDADVGLRTAAMNCCAKFVATAVCWNSPWTWAIRPGCGRGIARHDLVGLDDEDSRGPCGSATIRLLPWVSENSMRSGAATSAVTCASWMPARAERLDRRDAGAAGLGDASASGMPRATLAAICGGDGAGAVGRLAWRSSRRATRSRIWASGAGAAATIRPTPTSSIAGVVGQRLDHRIVVGGQLEAGS